jgi:hypothetical protein
MFNAVKSSDKRIAKALKMANLKPNRLPIIKNDWASYARSAIKKLSNNAGCTPYQLTVWQLEEMT